MRRFNVVVDIVERFICYDIFFEFIFVFVTFATKYFIINYLKTQAK